MAVDARFVDPADGTSVSLHTDHPVADPLTSQDDGPISQAERLLMEQSANADGSPRRPMNAFMLFARKRRPEVAAENHTLRTGEISKILSKEWSSLPANDKRYYNDLAKRLKDNFNARHPDYVYRRRPNNSRKRRRDHRVSADQSTDYSQLVGSGLTLGANDTGPFDSEDLDDDDAFDDQRHSPESPAVGFHSAGLSQPHVAVGSTMPAHHHHYSHHHPQQQQQQHNHRPFQHPHPHAYVPPAVAPSSAHATNGNPEQSPMTGTSRHLPHLYPVSSAPGPTSAVSATFSSGAPSPVSLHSHFSHANQPQPRPHPTPGLQQRHHSFDQSTAYSSLRRDSQGYTGASPQTGSAGEPLWDYQAASRAPSVTQHADSSSSIPLDSPSDITYSSSFAPLHQPRQIAHHDVSRMSRMTSSAPTPSSSGSGSSYFAQSAHSEPNLKLATHVNHSLASSSYPAGARHPYSSGSTDRSSASSAHSSAAHSPVNTQWVRHSDQHNSQQQQQQQQQHSQASTPSTSQATSQTPSPIGPASGSHHQPHPDGSQYPRLDSSGTDTQLPRLHHAVPQSKIEDYGLPTMYSYHGRVDLPRAPSAGHGQPLHLAPSGAVAPMSSQSVEHLPFGMSQPTSQSSTTQQS
ncbi:hypothetical protein BKA62DRAFT_686421 [Auriculariales sp. MPI-PUGE-AT-0066]|nr:hypothetical protein BKA62DRAFT_686421 [Auriculariales sp. MPI-PUGE-AT-0066]